MSDISRRAEHYGDPGEEARTLRQGCGLVERSGADRLVLAGEDRLRFLNGQMTCDLSTLVPGSGTYGFFTSVKGRIEADATVLALEDRLLLILPGGLGAKIRERLERYVIVDRVQVSAPEPEDRLTVIGPAAFGWLEEIAGAPPAESFAHRAVEVEGTPGRLVREGRLGSGAWSLWLPREAAEALSGRVAASEGDGAEVRRAGSEAYEAYRIEAGMSRFGQDFGPENFPQETGIEGAVSYTKGCYLGQEVVARLHYRGQVSRQLRLLEIPGQTSPTLPGELSFEGRTAGALTSAAGRFGGGDGLLGIGSVQRRAFEPGTEVELADGRTAVVRGLPAG